MQAKSKLLKQSKKNILTVLLLASVQSVLFAQISTAYSEEVDINGKPVCNLVKKDIYNAYPKAIKEKNGVTIVGESLDIKSMSIKEAEQLLKKKNITIDKKHKNITILKNTKNEVVYIGKNLTPAEIENQKNIIQKREDSMKNAESISLFLANDKELIVNKKDNSNTAVNHLKSKIKRTREQIVTTKTKSSEK